MDAFILYFKMGFYHVLDFSAFDHILFLIVLAVVFNFKQKSKVAWLVTLFTIGHSITLGLSAFGVVKVSTKLIEFLIPVTILITGFMNVFRAKKAASGSESINLIFALFFGLIHGLGFSTYFKMMVSKGEDKIVPLLEFALGIEVSQIIIVFGILVFGTFLDFFTRVSKRDWILVASSIVIGISFQMMLERIYW
ncbi:MAG: HupE/UreJ family protein [Polaribacter sp.]